MQRRATVLVALFAVAAMLIGAGSAPAQVNYRITSTPTFVINTGRAEALGAVRVTSQSTAGVTSIGSTLEFLFENIGCDNTAANGISLLLSGAFTAANTTLTGVSNTAAGCVVSVTIAGGVVMGAPGADFVELRSVRGRVDMSPAGAPNVGVDVNARLNATPSGSSLFTAPTIVRVGTSAVGRTVSVQNGTQLFCVAPPPTPAPRIRITEGFNGAFVHHVTSLALTAAPADARPAAGATNNTWIRIAVTDIPAGVTLTWPATVAGINIATSAVSAGSLERRSAATDTVQVYEFVTTSQGTSDINTEQFDISPTITLPTTLAIGTANVQVQLAPVLVTGDATSLTSSPSLVAGTKPRFNDPLTAVAPLLTVTPCTTQLLFPFVTNLAGFDTGIAVTNTSKDPYGTTAQSGTVTFRFYDKNATGPANVVTGAIVAGDAATLLISQVAPGFQGYVIASCNFQFGHGYAIVVNGYGTLAAPTTANAYLPLVIPDPLIGIAGTAGRLAVGDSLQGLLGVFSGEGLKQ